MPSQFGSCASLTTVVAIDTLANAVTAMASVVLPGAVWIEKAGSFENANSRLQAFEKAIDPIEHAKSEAQIALNLLGARIGKPAADYCPATTRSEMSKVAGLDSMSNALHAPEHSETVESDMQMVEL